MAAAIDSLADLPSEYSKLVDVNRVAVVGHSAGGQLAVWVASRPVLGSDQPGAEPVVVPVVAVSQAGVLDLVGCAGAGVGGTACVDLVGATPGAAPERYGATSPVELVPIEASVVAVHGDLDRIVSPAQSVTYVSGNAPASADVRPVPDASEAGRLAGYSVVMSRSTASPTGPPAH